MHCVFKYLTWRTWNSASLESHSFFGGAEGEGKMAGKARMSSTACSAIKAKKIWLIAETMY